MSTIGIAGNHDSIGKCYEDIYEPSTQKNSSLQQRVVAQLCRTANRVVLSINNIAQSILSKCIYVGSLGHYTLDNVKKYFFKDQSSLESEDAIKALANTDDSEFEVALDEGMHFEDDMAQTNEISVAENARKQHREESLQRRNSQISVTLSLYDKLQRSEEEREKNGGGLYPSLFSFHRRAVSHSKGAPSSEEAEKVSCERGGLSSLGEIAEEGVV